MNDAFNKNDGGLAKLVTTWLIDEVAIRRARSVSVTVSWFNSRCKKFASV